MESKAGFRGGLERVPEPELMEDEDQARAYAAADFSEPHQRFVTELQAALPDLGTDGVALDLGCGPADVTLRFARAFPGWRIDGIDGSAAMLRRGAAALARAGLGERVRLVQARLPQDHPPGDAYDLVLSNSLLHHLAEPGILWDALGRWLRPGAPFFVMDLRRPDSRHQAEALVALHAANEPAVLRRDFLHSLLASYRVAEVREQLQGVDLRGVRVAALGDRHWVAFGRR